LSDLGARGKVADVMWSLADRVVKAVSDVTVGTVIVLFHVAMADRARLRREDPHLQPRRLPS
jgi:hypothetical protein